MAVRFCVVVALVLAPGLVRAQSDSKACAGCHKGIWETYQRTGMARSFYRPTPTNSVEDYTRKNTFYHKASDSYFTMLERGGEYYQRRYQLDSGGRQINVMEKRIDFIMGSGNHSRAYLHRTERNTLVELPLAWYAEKGGYWGMNPGYDRANHDGFRRPITYDCMFCHNAYPQIPAGHEKPFSEAVYEQPLPEGIDCARCHGPGGKHMQLAKTAGTSAEQLRRSIVNPARLNGDRQMEVCMQCHLESTSFPLPNAIQRYERGPFSYQPGEELGAFILNFDHAAGQGRGEKFEIVNAAYRLRRSACFLKSGGKLGCTTCHNPHDVPRGEAAVKHYNAVCQQCHQTGQHFSSGDCISCHMPKRRTEDVVHVVVTDHYIQRRKPSGDLLADLEERHETDATAYRGEVVLYYPKTLAPAPENDLYLALAQVIQKSNLAAGIERLTAAIARYRPERAEYYFGLAEALRENGQLEKALPRYEEAVRRDPNFVAGWQKLGMTQRRAGNAGAAVEVLKRAVGRAPDNATTWHELGLSYRAQGNMAEAIAALEKAVKLDPDLAEAHNNLGILWFAGGAVARAEAAFREAIRIQPDYADAHGNLANLLAAAGDFKAAGEHFEIALRLRGDDAATRYNYAMELGRAGRIDEAQRQLEEALRIDGNLAEAHLLLAELLMAKGQVAAALGHYGEVLRIQPESGKGHLRLGLALASVGDVAGAVPHLQKAAGDADAGVRDEAREMLRRLGR